MRQQQNEHVLRNIIYMHLHSVWITRPKELEMPEAVLSDGLYRLVLVCALCVCGPCPGLRPPERGIAPRFPNRERARFP